jgi:hypothetical protein
MPPSVTAVRSSVNNDDLTYPYAYGFLILVAKLIGVLVAPKSGVHNARAQP